MQTALGRLAPYSPSKECVTSHLPLSNISGLILFAEYWPSGECHMLPGIMTTEPDMNVTVSVFENSLFDGSSDPFYFWHDKYHHTRGTLLYMDLSWQSCHPPSCPT